MVLYATRCHTHAAFPTTRCHKHRCCRRHCCCCCCCFIAFFIRFICWSVIIIFIFAANWIDWNPITHGLNMSRAPNTSPSLPLDAKHNDPVQNLLLSSIALLAKWIHACTVFAVLWKIKSVKIVAQSPQLLPTHNIFVFSRIHRPPYRSMPSTSPSLPLDATHTTFPTTRCQTHRCCRRHCCCCCSIDAIVAAVVCAVPPLNMCEWMLSVCLSGWWMHVWVVSACRVYMCECMVNACMSGC